MGRKLLFVVNHAGFFLSHRLPIALAAAKKMDVHVATPPSKHVQSIQDAGLDWQPVRITRSGTHPIGELKALSDLTTLYRRLRPDLVHHVTTKPVLWGTMAARMARVPAVVNALAGLGHLFLAEDLFHRLLRSSVKAGFRFSLRHPRMKVIFQNGDDRKAFTASGIVSSEDAVLIRGSGVDTEVFSPGNGRDHEPPIVMLPSRMLYTKGVGEFVGAARIIRGQGRNARFVLVGEPDPDNPASIQEHVLRDWQAEGLVECWGRRDDMPSVYAEADIVCLPSYREGLPKVLVEAAACGLPAVATDVPGCRDVVVDGETGILVPPRDEGSQIARAVQRLLDDPSLRRQMGRNGRARALEMFSLSLVVGQTLELYEELLR